jgi:hypothetical protein
MKKVASSLWLDYMALYPRREGSSK